MFCLQMVLHLFWPLSLPLYPSKRFPRGARNQSVDLGALCRAHPAALFIQLGPLFCWGLLTIYCVWPKRFERSNVSSDEIFFIPIVIGQRGSVPGARGARPGVRRDIGVRRGAAGNLQPRPRRETLWHSCRRRGDLLVGLAGRHVLRVRFLLDVRYRRRALGNKLEYIYRPQAGGRITETPHIRHRRRGALDKLAYS